MDITLPPQASGHQGFVQRALQQWCGGARMHCRALTSGRSGSSVLRADLSGIIRGNISPGQYILKLGTFALNEPEFRARAALEAAKSYGPELFGEHIPEILAQYSEAEDEVRTEAILLQVAGGSLRRYSSAAALDSPALVDNITRLVTDLYSSFLAANETADLTIIQVMTELMTSRRLDDSLEISKRLSSSRGAEFTPYGPLVWPHHFAAIVGLDHDRIQVVKGFNHRDLHGGNMLFEDLPTPGQDPKYFLIDFDEGEPGPFAYDPAYLEAERFIFGCDGVQPIVAAQLLRYPISDEGNTPAGTATFRAFRNSLHRAEAAAQQKGTWADALEQQAILARVCAGLMWVRRQDSLTRTQQHSAHLFAAAYCGTYLSQYLPELLASVDSGGFVTTASPPLTPEPESAAAVETFDALDQLNGRSHRLILVSERVEGDLAAIGQVPWSAVIDLDPTSSDDGLFKAAQPNLEAIRGIHRFSRDVPEVISTRGTAWMFANGWREIGEPTLGDRDWTYKTVPVVRKLMRQIRALAGDVPVSVVVLGGSIPSTQTNGHGAGVDRSARAMEAIDEVFEGEVNFYVFGEIPASPTVRSVNVAATSQEFVKTLASRLGSATQSKNIEIPGKTGWVELPPSLYSPMQESFELLHRYIGTDDADPGHEDSFHRGGLATWADLHESADVERDIYPRLAKTVRDELKSHKTRTVILNHNPGSGASTLARRLAWDLRLTSPVCILRRDQPIGSGQIGGLAERLRQLFTMAEAPILCIAEPSSLTETGREQLHRELSSRGTRVVLLYLRRTFKEGGGNHGLSGISLLDPMSTVETTRFRAVFGELTEEPTRRAELAKLSLPGYARYRSPFFYGLITFDGEFAGIENYVANHIAGLRGRSRDTLEYLAFVTLYADAGLELSTVKKLLGRRADAKLTLSDLFGEQASRLLVQIGEHVRVMHHRLAEEVLHDLVGGGSPWRQHGHDLAIDFIRDLAEFTDTRSDSTRRLLRQIFVERPGTRFDEVDDRGAFSPFIEELDAIDHSLGHRVLRTLTEHFDFEAHFWAHLGRHQIYRVGRDFVDAVDYLERAISLTGEDPVHYHVLGQVKRYIMKHTIRQNPRSSGPKLLSLIMEPYSSASHAFTQSRSLAPDNIYGYITHIQLTVEAALSLRNASKTKSVGDISDPVVGEWIRSELALANELADSASLLYGALDDSDDYLKRCMSDLRRLYGDLDRVVEIWEIATSGSGASSYGRRSLAHAYLLRADRRWSALSDAELQRIASLMSSNLRGPRPVEEDFRLWFDASRQLESFDVDEALGNLALWNERVESWRPGFYSMVLNFILWYQGRLTGLEDYRAALESSKRLAVGRSRNSLMWFAMGPEQCPLLGADELGKWDRERNFWESAEGLRRVNGVIDESIEGPTSGRVVIDGQIRVFFVPAAGNFSKNADEGSDVNFFLGFSPEGPRAWDVQRGHVDGANRRRLGDVDPIVWTERSSATRVSATAGNLRRERIASFALELVSARAAVGAETTFEDLLGRVGAVFGSGQTASKSLSSELVDIVSSSNNIDLAGSEALTPDTLVVVSGERRLQETLQCGEIAGVDSNRRTVTLRRKSGPNVTLPAKDELLALRPGSWVSFIDRGGNIQGRSVKGLAHGTCVVSGEIVEVSDLPAILSALIFAALDAAASAGDRSIRLSDGMALLQKAYSGPGALLKAMGAGSRDELFDRLPGVQRAGGRLLRVTDKRASDRDSVIPGVALPQEILGHLRSIATAKGSSTLAPTDVGSGLKAALGEDRYAAWLGNRSLTSRLQSIRGVSVSKGDGGQLEVRVSKRSNFRRNSSGGKK